MVNAVEAFDAKHMKPAEEIPAFRPGDTVDVLVMVSGLVSLLVLLGLLVFARRQLFSEFDKQFSA